MNENNCSLFADCNDTIGSYECTCLAGYTGDGYSCVGMEEDLPCVHCIILWVMSTDFDECADTENYPCHSDANCSNTFGSFWCTCLPGYSGNGMTCTGS